jgi:hypothetical protein
METANLDRHTPLETALNRAGFTVEGIEQQDKKTVITVSRRTRGGEKPVFPVSGAALPAQSSEERKRS